MKEYGRPRREMGTRTLVMFFLITFGLCWGLGAAMTFFPEQIEALAGPVGMTNPLFILAVYSPAIAGVGLVWWTHGLGGLRRYARRLLMFRMPAAWWAYLVVGLPAVFVVGALLKGEGLATFAFAPWYSVLPALGLALVLGPMEELGWRGLALPLLLERMAPFWAGLFTGTMWALWHLPAFLIEGTPQSSWSFGAFFVGLVAVELSLTPLFEAARGSIVIPMLYHFQLNNPIWPDAQPFDSYLFVAVAIVVVLLNRRTMFRRAPGRIDVVPGMGAIEMASGAAASDMAPGVGAIGEGPGARRTGQAHPNLYRAALVSLPSRGHMETR